MVGISDLIKELHNSQDEKNEDLEIEILLKLAQKYFDKKQYKKATISLNQILRIDINYKKINYYLALIELSKNEDDTARIYLKKELKKNPNDVIAKDLLDKLKISKNIPLVTITLAILNILVYFFYTKSHINFINLIKFGLNSNSLTFHNLFTSIFFQADIFHLIFNISLLLMFGIIFEKDVGSFRFSLIFFSSALIGNFFQALLIPSSFVIGASAGIFGIFGGLVMRTPFLNIKILGLIKIPLIIVFGAFFSIASILDSYLNLFNLGFSIGGYAHLIGFLVGILITGILYTKTIGVFYNWISIGFGFWLVIHEIKDFTINNINSINLFLWLFFILIGSFIIYFGYKNLYQRIIKIPI